MSPNQFWYSDTRLLGVYQKAYLRNQSYNAWLQGNYNATAFGIVLYNSFSKEGTKAKDYPKWQDPIPKPTQEIITKDNIEQKFRESQAKQNAWLYGLLHK